MKTVSKPIKVKAIAITPRQIVTIELYTNARAMAIRPPGGPYHQRNDTQDTNQDQRYNLRAGKKRMTSRTSFMWSAARSLKTLAGPRLATTAAVRARFRQKNELCHHRPI